MRIGIYYTGGSDWTGGERYVRNLILALRHVPFAEPVFIAPANKTDAELAPWKDLGCEVLLEQSLSRWTASWWLRQIARRTRRVNHDIWSELFLEHHRIGATYLRPCLGRGGGIPNISWVPDFQHLHLPDMFSREDIEFRTTQILLAAQYSTHIILSSHHAYHDFSQLSPIYAGKGRVLQFVASVDPKIYRHDPREASVRLGMPDKFFYSPNQFWRHKNHLVVVQALGVLKRKGQHAVVVCTGNTKDYRHPAYLEELTEAIRQNGVGDRFFMLGMVSPEDVFSLTRQSIAILNPSLFEGWSTTVEEAKSVGKRVLLSDIPVHIEQDPPGATYFARNDPEDLALKMQELWSQVSPGPDVVMEARARGSLQTRLVEFGTRFFDVVQEASAA